MPELVLTQDQLVPQSQLTNEQFLASLETDFSKDANARLAKSRAAALKENLAKAKARNPLMDDIISGFEAGEIGDSVTKPDGGFPLPGRDTIISETVAKEDLNKTPLLLTQEQMIAKINEPLIGSDTVTNPELSFEDALKNVNMNGAPQDTLFNTLNPGDPQPSQTFKTPMSGLELQQSQDEAARVASLLAGQGRRQEGQTPDRNFPTDIPRPGTDTIEDRLARLLKNQQRRQQSQRDGIGSLANVPPKAAPLEGDILDALGPFGRGEVPPTGQTIEGEAVDLNQVPSPMGRADMDPFLYEGDVIDPVKTTDLTEAKAPVVDTIEGTIIDQTRRQQGQLGGIGSLNAAGKPVVRAPTFIDSEVLSPTDGTPYFPELPTDDVLPPEEREGGGPGGDDRPDVVPPMQTVDGEDGGCPPGYRRVLDPATGRYICLKIEEGSVGAPAAPSAPSAPAEEEEDGAVIDIPVTERPTISPYYVPEPIESRYTPYVPGRR